LRASIHAIVLALLLGLAAASHAKEGSVILSKGSRVRIHVLALGPAGRDPLLERRSIETVVGTFAGLLHDTLAVDREGDAARVGIPLGSVASLETSLGRRSRTGRGVQIGLLAGTVAGVVTGLVVCANGNCETSGIGDATAIVTSALGLGGAVAGAGIGAGVGAMVKTERWAHVSLLDVRWGSGALD